MPAAAERPHDTHVVMTRFNIPIDYDGRSNPRVTAIDPRTDREYLDWRFNLFERYTYASLKSQSDQDFEWWVLFSDQTPETYRRRLEELHEAMPNFQPLYLSDQEANDLDAYLADRLAAVECERLLTTRIDNDDAVPRSFIERIHRVVAEKNLQIAVVSFPIGARYVTSTGEASHTDIFGNHFITFVEPKKDRNRVILSYHHDASPEDLERVGIRTPASEPMWVEVIHGSNYANQMYLRAWTMATSPRTFDDYASDFPWGKEEQARTRRSAWSNTFANLVPDARRILGGLLGKP